MAHSFYFNLPDFAETFKVQTLFEIFFSRFLLSKLGRLRFFFFENFLFEIYNPTQMKIFRPWWKVADQERSDSKTNFRPCSTRNIMVQLGLANYSGRPKTNSGWTPCPNNFYHRVKTGPWSIKLFWMGRKKIFWAGPKKSIVGPRDQSGRAGLWLKHYFFASTCLKCDLLDRA